MKRDGIVRFAIFLMLIVASFIPYYCGTTRDDAGPDIRGKDAVSKDVSGLEDIEITRWLQSIISRVEL
ncbi:MAG: hypothetical protein ACPL7I_05500 [Myxococcota bacterium]